MEQTKKTILIVEDERAIVDIIKFNLMREGYDTLEALDGETGLELARTLWERGYPARVVLLSAHGEFDYARQGIAYGVAAYLLKPVRHEELLTVLNETASALENRREDRGAPIEDDVDEGLVLRVERYVRAHIAEELNVGRVAEAMHYSERHFRRQFQKEAR